MKLASNLTIASENSEGSRVLGDIEGVHSSRPMPVESLADATDSPMATKATDSLPFLCVLTAMCTMLSPGTATAMGKGHSHVKNRPNIIIIVSDDLNYGSLGRTGHLETQTPHIDSLIQGGAFFTNGYVSGPVCAPSRAGLMTGRYQARFGYERKTHSVDQQIANNVGVDTREILLPQLLEDAGYATAVIGKWHLGYNEEFHPNHRGVDYFFGFLSGGHGYFDWDPTSKDPILRNQQLAGGEGYVTERLAAEAADFIRRNRKKPFFLYYAPSNVHRPHVVPEKYLPENGNVMAGMVKALDDSVGVILDALREYKLLTNTLIVFINDNGGVGSNNPYRGRKEELYEGGIHVPFSMRWPGRIPDESVYKKPVISLDVFPTVACAAGVALPRDREYDGVNLLPYLMGLETGTPHETLFWRYPLRRERWRAVRSGDFKLLRMPEVLSLFNLRLDPLEERNLVKRRPKTVARLKKALRLWEEAVDSPNQYGLKLGPPPEIDPSGKKPGPHARDACEWLRHLEKSKPHAKSRE